ncbi:MAG: transaldolase [Nitrospirae bacterium]|nr:transaldolase [Nitrospirota bacterium]
MVSNPLKELGKVGQSFWYDNISRELINSGMLKIMVAEDGLTGITSNPSIFYKSISASSDYLEPMKKLSAKESISSKEIFYHLEFEDIKDAADLLKPVYDSTGGKDGYVSIEVDPNFAADTEATVAEARDIFSRIDRPNVMIKVPATKEGIPAIARLTSEGYNVNATLLFSVKRYGEVVEAYLEGLQRRLSNGQEINGIASVASFFISRMDTYIDKLLNEKMQLYNNTEEHDWLKSLMGKTAIANAKSAYQVMVSSFSSERFLKLKSRGARVQRLLWASTSTKNPSYGDCHYVDNLIGPHTINTIPEDTVRCFRKHGSVVRTVDKDLEEVEIVLNSLEDLNIDIEEAAGKLEEDGVKQFIDSFNALLKLVGEKCREL